jgi:hypothetical protein
MKDLRVKECPKPGFIFSNSGFILSKTIKPAQ